MRTTHSPAAAAGRTLGRVLKAGLSLLVLAGAVAGLPLLLVWVTPVIWASTHDDLTHLLDRQDTGAAFLLLLVAVGWIGWAQFTFCAVRELIAQVRGRAWHAPRGLGASQRAAALLIGSILVLLPTSSALASDAQAAPATTAARLPGQAQASQVAAADQAPASAASTPKAPTYTVRQVRPAESLWSIAEKELGDGERWREIASLNEGRVMSDGQVFRANSFLQPGWDLQMPQTSFGHAAAALAGGSRTQLSERESAATGQEEHVVTVESGDYLSKIAEEELGDGNQWPELFAASRGKPQPAALPKITDPDVIYAGQQVTVPGAPSRWRDRGPDDDEAEGSGGGPHTPPATEDPQDGQEKGDASTPSPSESAGPTPQSSAPSELTNRPSDPAGSPAHKPRQSDAGGLPPATLRPSPATSATESAAPSQPAASPTAATSQEPASQPASSPLHLRTVLGAGALLAAAITAALAMRRVLQRRRRRPGEKIVIAPETSPAEAKLQAAAEPGGAAHLDRALRTLAHLAKQHGEQVPGLRAARIGARSLHVLPEDLSQQPRAPFTTGQAGWWQLADDAELLNEDEAQGVPAPYPGLVTVGSTASGDLVLANLAQVPALLLDGNPVHISEVCTSLALELGMSPWAADVEVVTIGFGEDLPQLLPTTRIAHMRQPAHALRDVTERLLEAHQMPETAHQPYLLLCAAVMDPDTAWEFADVIDKAGRVPVTLIAPASSTAAHFPQAEILNASVHTPQPFDYLGTAITVQRLEHAAYQQITAALALSGQPAQDAEGPWQEVPDELHVEAPPQPDLAEEPATAEAHDEEQSATAAPVSAALGAEDEEVFPALLAACADPSSFRLWPGTPNRGQTCGDGEEQDSVTAKAPQADPAKAAADEAPRSPVQEPDHATAGDKGSAAHDLNAPEIRVLGPVEVDRVGPTGHGPRIAQLAALMFFRPGRTADALCADMDPLNPWSPATLNARLQGLRRALGNDAAGNAYVPRRRSGDDPYLLSPAVRCDWPRFLHLAERALPQAAAGLPDLEKALSLVRGRPFGTRPLPWAEPYRQEMITRIIDVAHTVATYRTPAGPHHDLSAARQAIATGLEVDESAELLYRDWMKIERTAGNRSGLHTAISRVQQVNRALDCDLELETEQLISDLLNGSGPTLVEAEAL
ncbi:LysM peptidoglycan-binding domain-containing protein [Streptomyces sp. NPDC002758]